MQYSNECLSANALPYLVLVVCPVVVVVAARCVQFGLPKNLALVLLCAAKRSEGCAS